MRTICGSSISHSSVKTRVTVLSLNKKRHIYPFMATESDSSVSHPSSVSSHWGPALWRIFHVLAANYPQDNSPSVLNKYKASARQFFYALRDLLPCPTCREHYSKLLTQSPPQLETSESMKQWVLDLHNAVNERLGDQKSWSMEDIERVYQRDVLETTHEFASMSVTYNDVEPVSSQLASQLQSFHQEEEEDISSSQVIPPLQDVMTTLPHIPTTAPESHTKATPTASVYTYPPHARASYHIQHSSPRKPGPFKRLPNIQVVQAPGSPRLVLPSFKHLPALPTRNVQNFFPNVAPIDPVTSPRGKPMSPRQLMQEINARVAPSPRRTQRIAVTVPAPIMASAFIGAPHLRIPKIAPRTIRMVSPRKLNRPTPVMAKSTMTRSNPPQPAPTVAKSTTSAPATCNKKTGKGCGTTTTVDPRTGKQVVKKRKCGCGR